MAAPFDPGSLQLAGEAAPVAEDVDLSGFSVSSSGVLVYRTGARVVADLAVAGTQGVLTWFDRQGKVLGTEGDPGFYSFGVKLSPDGTRVALTRPDERGNFDIWIYEFARGVYRRFTIDPGPDRAPVWSPDGSRITFVSNASYDPGAGVYQKAANGGKEELLVKLTTASALNEWSRDGRFLLFYTGGATAGDLSVYAAGQAGEPKIVPLLKEPYVERGGSFSPDGRWFVYTSNESGKFEVYARAFDAASITANGDQFIVSRGGGQAPHWSRDGKEIFYQALDGTITAVPVATSPAFKAGAPQALFKTPVVPFWDVTADGKKFLIPVSGGANSPAPYKVVLNWTSTLNKK
jgi:Tol biopolymer transport system component